MSFVEMDLLSKTDATDANVICVELRSSQIL